MQKFAAGALLLMIVGTSHANADLDIDVMPAQANIDATESRVKLLPRLEFPLSLYARCREPAMLERVSLSVADVRQSWSGVEAESAIDTVIAVPGKQIAPVVTEFCMLDQALVSKPKLIEAVLTAQIAVRCASGDASTIDYRSLPLDVELGCDQPASDESVDASEPPASEDSS